MRVKKNCIVKYPIFAECSKLIEDEYYIDLFTRMSYGRFPQRIACKDASLYHIKGKKLSILELNPEPYICLEDVIQFLYKHEGIISSNFHVEETMVNETAEIPTIWSEFNSKSQEYMLDVYFFQLSRKYHLNTHQQILLKMVRRIILFKKYVNDSTVIIENGMIKSIKCIEYNDGKFIIIPSTAKNKARKRKTKQNSTSSVIISSRGS